MFACNIFCKCLSWVHHDMKPSRKHDVCIHMIANHETCSFSNLNVLFFVSFSPGLFTFHFQKRLPRASEHRWHLATCALQHWSKDSVAKDRSVSRVCPENTNQKERLLAEADYTKYSLTVPAVPLAFLYRRCLRLHICFVSEQHI